MNTIRFNRNVLLILLGAIFAFLFLIKILYSAVGNQLDLSRKRIFVENYQKRTELTGTLLRKVHSIGAYLPLPKIDFQSSLKRISPFFITLSSIFSQIIH